MSERMDDLAKIVAAGTTRRSALAGLSGLAFGTLGIIGLRQETAAANNNECSQCKRQCRRNNKKSGKKHPNNCSSKCRNRCNNN